MVEPLFILAPHRSFTSIVCAMLGQHPQMYGLPEMNLFMTETMEEWWSLYRQGQALGANGLFRAVAQMYFGEQTRETIVLAWWWIWRRLHWDTGSMFMELTAKAHPFILVEKSPNTVSRVERLQRLCRVFPEAKFLHLLRHPRGNSESVITSLREFGIKPARLHVRLSAGVDPQKRWYLIHSNICSFLAPLPQAQKMRLRGEDLLADPDRYLCEIAEWLGLRTDAEAIEQMKHPEKSPYACFGPSSAPLGNDIHFLKRPVLRTNGMKVQSLEGPLSWREDRMGFLPEVKQLARAFGYT
jgi:hypothetical protein